MKGRKCAYCGKPMGNSNHKVNGVYVHVKCHDAYVEQGNRMAKEVEQMPVVEKKNPNFNYANWGLLVVSLVVISLGVLQKSRIIAIAGAIVFIIIAVGLLAKNMEE